MMERQMEWWIDGQKDLRYDELSGGFPSPRTRRQAMKTWNISKGNCCLLLDDNSTLKVNFPLLKTLCLRELLDKSIVSD